MKDKLGRTLNYARISVTDLCNMRCRYCMPAEGVIKKEHGQILSVEQITAVAEALAQLGFDKIRLTGGEPLVRRGIIKIAQNIGGIDGVKALAITTNGTLLTQYAVPLKESGVNRVNISIDTLNAEKYKFITRIGELDAALKGLDFALKTGFDEVKINAVLLKGVNDGEVNDFIKLSEDKHVEVRFIEVMPFKAQEEFAKQYYLGADEIIAKYPGLKYLGTQDNSVAEYYTSANGGKIGFINPLSHKFCSRCNRIRITSDGLLFNCLHHSECYDLKPYIGNGLRNALQNFILSKPAGHNLENGELQDRPMKKIGG